MSGITGSVPITVSITRVMDGVRREFHTEDFCWDGRPYEFEDFIWTEGNYSCDCNRELFFERAAGKEHGEIDSPCGKGRFRIDWIKIDSTGETVYTERPN
jgi:hypothetical protein